MGGEMFEVLILLSFSSTFRATPIPLRLRNVAMYGVLG